MADKVALLDYPRFNKKVVVLVVAAFAVVGTVATFLTHAAQLSGEETVRLSNGKEIRLDEPVNEVTQTVGSDLYKLSSRQYEYPGKPGKPIEVVMDIDQARIVTIHLVNTPGGVARSNQSQVGTSLAKIALDNRRAQGFSGLIAQLRSKGLVVEQTRSKLYFFTNPCTGGDLTSMISLTLKGYENRVVEDLGGPGCKGE